MIVSFNSTAVCILSAAVLLNVSPCNCRKSECDSSSHGVTRGINFKLKDKINGNDILSYNGAIYPVPDSIKLKNINTGVFYFLFVVGVAGDALIYSQQYARPANVTDSLLFFYGNSLPDTLIISTGLVDGWRGDECPAVKDPGIIRVTLRNQVLVETTNDDAVFILRK